MKKKIIALASIGAGIVLPFVNIANAQFATSTVTTILNDTLDDAGSILQVNLPIIFVFLLAVTATLMVFRWIRGVLRKPR